MRYLFTSESVGAGHPDKIADQISDAVLDACLRQDKHSRVACECFIARGLVVIGGEIRTRAQIDLESIARKVVHDIGYTKTEHGLSADGMGVLNCMGKQSQDIAQGVDSRGKKKQGAGDQGIMFGYACDETKELMPAPIMLSHTILRHAEKLRKKDPEFSWLRPDAKCQVTMQYEGDKPKFVDSVLLSHQYSETHKGKKISPQYISRQLIEKVLRPVLEGAGFLDKKTKFIVNPTGRFVVGGPHADTGLTGRKIIVDTYGGVGSHGGGAFSGKDPSKVDRSASYMARYIAKNIVAAKIAKKCQIQLAYVIGRDKLAGIYINTFGTGRVSDELLSKKIVQIVDTTPAGIIKTLDLLRPIYQKTAVYGHFGRNEKDFTWEHCDIKEKIQKAL